MNVGIDLMHVPVAGHGGLTTVLKVIEKTKPNQGREKVGGWRPGKTGGPTPKEVR